MHTSFSHHRSGRHPAFPARRTLRLMPDLPGRHIQSARRHATVLRLVVRSDDFAFAQLDAAPAPASPGFAVRLLPRPSCAPDRSRPYEIGRPAHTIIPTHPLQSVSAIPRLTYVTMDIRPAAAGVSCDYTS